MHVGRSPFSRCCYLFGDLSFTQEWNVAQAINAVTGTRLWLFCLSLPGTILIWFCVGFLRGCRNRQSAAVMEWLVHFSAHPQMMQQHRQLSCRGHDGLLLSVSSAMAPKTSCKAFLVWNGCEEKIRVKDKHKMSPNIN